MVRTVRFVFTGLAIGVAALAAAGPARAQSVRLGVVMDNPRQALETAWTDDAKQLERAYCVTDWSYGVYHISKVAPIQDDTIFRVFAIRPAESTNASPVAVDFDCPDGMPEMHVHTPTTCAGEDVKTCVTGGLNAYSCQPSRGDLEKLVRRRDQFAVLQCDRHAFRFYYPAEYRPPNALASGPDQQPKVGNLTPAMKVTTPLAPPASSGGSGSSP